ncbi:MAG: hypothetical protein ICV65_15535 [Flavisolibacter sp.]|nr:hypothetical protein [Flavisolibacter sp.]
MVIIPKSHQRNGGAAGALQGRQSKAIVRHPIRFLHLLKSGACTTQAGAGQQIARKRRASEKLWSKYQREGIEGLLTYPYQGTKGKLTEAQLRLLHKELRNNNIQSRQQACAYGHKQLGVPYTTSASGMCLSA